MQRKLFIRNHYSKFWLNARERKYGFPAHNRSVCDYIINNIKGSRVLDVGTGTGYPHADYLQRAGFEVYGVDIAPLLIQKCRSLYPSIRVAVADAERLPYRDNSFDAVYSISSTKYFPDIERAIEEMMRVAKGMVVFDVWNAGNRETQRAYQQALSGGTALARLKRRLLRREHVVHETPSYLGDVYRLLERLGVRYRVAVSRNSSKDEPIEMQGEMGGLEEHTAVVVIVEIDK